MRWTSVIGWGIVIYAIMFLSWNGLVIHGFSSGFLPRIFELIVLVAVTVVAGRSLRFHSWKDILPYSFLWAVISGLLDIVYSVPYGGWNIYSDWNLWVGYALVVLLPLLAPLTRRRDVEAAPIT